MTKSEKRIRKLWNEDEVTIAVLLKHECIEKGLLTQQEIQELAFVPSKESYYADLFSGPPKHKISRCAKTRVQSWRSAGQDPVVSLRQE